MMVAPGVDDPLSHGSTQIWMCPDVLTTGWHSKLGAGAVTCGRRLGGGATTGGEPPVAGLAEGTVVVLLLVVLVVVVEASEVVVIGGRVVVVVDWGVPVVGGGPYTHDPGDGLVRTAFQLAPSVRVPSTLPAWGYEVPKGPLSQPPWTVPEPW